MTIHSNFWSDRHAAARTMIMGNGRLNSVRDSNRQRCYNWEFKELRPVQKKLDYDGARGYARLCVKIAIRRMREMGLITTDARADEVRASFKAAFTKENQKKCNANHSGAYFARWGWTDVIVAHEVAHWADQWAHKLGGVGYVSYEAHGPKWRGWFVHILSNAGMRGLPGLLDPVTATKNMMLRTLGEARLAVTIP